MHLVITPRGRVHAIYGELIDLAELGRLQIRRVSCVEPDAYGRWSADLSPISGPRLGPFARRSAALDAELRWLERHWLTRPR